ncbi:bifunctional GNAT family N-acetyltransferase/acetate--CoA ligase family protein [Streptantibioticus ferralitis]|uniref:GNAT family N-acetyltransferase n=1 Tax=Streptantibioticus ferralitis TaxID=236510 RepID=A0ABT5Z5H6_9ACTN|nr:bifunctional GNAT family N-acetyltransferase/acetate--CoA ligase family protein [Streptantibioticus ferralitis]MDF2259075.1 GNAT family N-acetyltransferase [Streptantibioticus ferralitis]
METSRTPVYPVHWEADVVLRDGGIAHIRPITADDARRLVSFYEQVSDESKYYRFFAPYPRLSDRDVRRFTHHDYVDRVGLAAMVGGEFIATVRYDRLDDGVAEVAFLVQDAHQGRGVASALLEHIAAVARENGIRRFDAEVLPANRKMIKVFTDVGYTAQRSFTDGVVRLELDLEPTEASVAVMRAREQRAEARSVQRLLAPRSVAVIGTGRAEGGVGRTMLRNLLAGGFTGRLYAVNRNFPQGMDVLEPEGVPGYRSVAGIDEPVDLAILAVPAAAVPDAVADCGAHGVQGLLVVANGYAESGPQGRQRQRALVRQARSYGMRVIGPNAFGLLNTAPAVRLNASLSPETPPPGRLGLFTQSGAIGIALLSGLHRRGAGLGGISTFVSAGNRADVSGNDLLQYWHDDPDTDVALMYLESIGNPRKFTRLARRTAAVKPVVVVKGARHTGSLPPGHTVPVTRIPDATVSALLRQAGIIRVDTVTELLDTGALLAHQPLPAGERVAILGNSESLGLLAYDACLSAGLRPAPPRDLTTGAAPGDFHDALAEALADGAVDAVLVTAIPRVGAVDAHDPDSGDDPSLAAALRAAAASATKPVAVVQLALDRLADRLGGADEAPKDMAAAPADTDGATARRASRIPAYPAAERAVRALAEAVRYARWRREDATPGRVPELDGIDEAAARADVERLLDATEPEGGRGVTLDDAAGRALLGRYGIEVRAALPAPGAESAIAAARRLGYPVALKATAPHLRHRADLGGVRLDLAGEGELRRAYEELTQRLGKPTEVLPVVQSMAPRGVDTVVRAAVDPAAGSVLSFGLAGAASELLGDLAHHLIPVTDRDAAQLVRTIKAAPMLFGWRGAEPADTAALEETLLRVSRLVDDLPEVVSVHLEPVVVARRGLGVTVLGATVRLAHPPARTDLGPRALSSL